MSNKAKYPSKFENSLQIPTFSCNEHPNSTFFPLNLIIKLKAQIYFSPLLLIDSASSSSSSDSSDDEDEAEGKTSETASDIPAKSSTGSQQSQRGQKRDGEDKKPDGKRISGSGDNRKPKQRKDQPLYQSPKSRAVPPSRVASRRSPTRDSHPIKRSCSSEHVYVTSSSKSPQRMVRQQRHSSSPGRLADRASPYVERRFAGRQQHASGADFQSPASRRRSPVSRQKSPVGQPKSPQFRRPKSPQAARSLSPPLRQRSPDVRCRSPRFQKPHSTGTRRQVSGRENWSNSPRAEHLNKQPQQRRISPSPDRKTEKSRQRSPPPGRSTHVNPPYAKQQGKGNDGKKANSPWYTCSSPPRSGDLLEDHMEDKKHGDLELASQPLIIPTKELQKLTLELGSFVGGSSSSLGEGKISTEQIKATDNQEIPAANVKSTKQVATPGFHVSSAIPSASLSNKGAQHVQRQVTSSAKGQLLVTCQTGASAAKPDVAEDEQGLQQKGRTVPIVATKVPLKEPTAHKTPPGLAKLTDVPVAKVKEASEIPVTVPQHLAPGTQPFTHQQPKEVPSSQQLRTSSSAVTHPSVRQGSGLGEVPSNQQIHTTQFSQATKHQRPAATQPVQHQGPPVNQPQKAPNQALSKPPTSSTGPAAPATSPIASVKLIHGSVINVVVCEVNSPGSFFVQPANSPLQQLMSEIR